MSAVPHEFAENVAYRMVYGFAAAQAGIRRQFSDPRFWKDAEATAEILADVAHRVGLESADPIVREAASDALGAASEVLSEATSTLQTSWRDPPVTAIFPGT